MMTSYRIKHRPVYNGEPDGDYPSVMHRAQAYWELNGGDPDFNILEVKDQGLKQEIAITTGFKYNHSLFPLDLIGLYKMKGIDPIDKRVSDPSLPNKISIDNDVVFIRRLTDGVKIEWVFENEEHWRYEAPYSEENFSVIYKFHSSDRVPHKWCNYHRK